VVLEAALKSAQPLRAIWLFSTDQESTRLTMEFMGLANHRKELRAEISYYAERFREDQRVAMSAALERYGVDPGDVPPVVWAVIGTSLSWALVMEQALGMSAGHAETLEFVERWLRELEGEALPLEQIFGDLAGSGFEAAAGKLRPGTDD